MELLMKKEKFKKICERVNIKYTDSLYKRYIRMVKKTDRLNNSEEDEEPKPQAPTIFVRSRK